MQRDRYGFVYLWYDRKHKRFYLGCHWGREDDGYICSSRWMRKSYRRRPQDFGKRKIIVRIYTNRKDLLEEEYRWLSMIKDEELGNKYYNLSKKHFGHWFSNENKRLLIIEKCRIGNIGKKLSGETKQKISVALVGRVSAMKGKNHSEEAKQRTSETLKGRKKGPLSEKHRQNLSLSLKGRTVWNKGLSKSTDERVMNHSLSLIGHPNYNKDGINQYSGFE